MKVMVAAAQMNKERSAQITELQYRKQVETEQSAKVDQAQLMMKELQDRINREKVASKLQEMLQNKYQLQAQIDEFKQKEADAKMEYIKERNQVDNMIQRMIEEDRENARI